MANEEITTRLVKVLSATLHRKLGSVPGDKPLRELGLNSVSMFDFIVGLEEEFSIHIDDEEVVPELFENIESLSDFIKKKADN